MTLIRRIGATSGPLLTGPLAGLFLFAFVSPAGAADPVRSPSRLIPARGLAVYLEYDGVGGGHAEAWRATAAYAVLNGTPAGEALTSVARQVVDRLLNDAADVKMTGADIGGLFDHISRHGFLFAVYQQKDAPGTAVLVLNGFGRKDARERADRMIRGLVAAEGGGGLPEPIRFRGRELYQPKPADADKPEPGTPPAKDKDGDGPTLLSTWWFEGDDLIVIDGAPLGKRAKPSDENAKGAPLVKDTVVAVLDAIDGVEPSASTHPGRDAALAEGHEIPGFAPNGLFFVESGRDGVLLQDLLDQMDAAIPRDAPKKLRNELNDTDVKAKEINEIPILGLDRVKRIVGRWGFRGKALLTDVRFEVPAPRTGLLRLLDQPGCRTDRLPPIPKGAGAFAIGSFDPGKSYDDFVAMLKTFGPASAGEIDKAMEDAKTAVRDATGQRLREDLLAHVGPTWCVYTTQFR